MIRSLEPESDAVEKERDLGARAWRSGVPSGRTIDSIARFVVGPDLEKVWMADGVGGAKPPVMPRKNLISSCSKYNASEMICTFLKTKSVFRERHEKRWVPDGCSG